MKAVVDAMALLRMVRGFYPMPAPNKKRIQAFETLSTGELYHIASPDLIEKGLDLYGAGAVKSLVWDEKGIKLVGTVDPGNGAPVEEVLLSIRRGALSHQCSSSKWAKDKQCECVAAAAGAIFLAMQGKNIGDYDLPEGYEDRLRAGLGYETSVAGDLEDTKFALLLSMNPANGYAWFEILNAVPEGFLQDAGVALAKNRDGLGLANEFYLGAAERNLPRILEAAEKHNVELLIDIKGQRKPLRIGDDSFKMQVILNHSSPSVTSRLRILDKDGDRVHVFGMVPESHYFISMDGELQHAQANPAEPLFMILPPPDGEDFELFLRGSEIDSMDFNESALLTLFDPNWVVDGELILEARERRRAADLDICDPKETALEVGLTLTDGQDDVGVVFRIKCDDREFDLLPIVEKLLEPLLVPTGALLNAKSRVRTLLELVRAFISASIEEREALLLKFPNTYPELGNDAYSVHVTVILKKLSDLLTKGGGVYSILAADDETGHWTSFEIKTDQIAMLVFSICSPDTKGDLDDLGMGVVNSPSYAGRGQVLQRAAVVCQTLGIPFFIGESQVRTQAVSIEVEGDAPAGGIDWFELHPAIRCGDHSLSAEEWTQLISGNLLLRDAEGNLLLPSIDGGEAEGLKFLSELLKRNKSEEAESDDGDVPSYKVSRLEMLDWLRLRSMGIDVKLPDEAERLFTSLSNFEKIEEFQQPETLDASLRHYQSEGCAWIDFHYEHRLGACLADDMGLGKTVQTIGFLAKQLEKLESPMETASILVVVPPSLVFNWMDEFRRFSPSIRVTECLQTGTFEQIAKGFDVVITTYDRIRLEIDAMEDYHFDIVVFDEAHNLKNVSTARTKAAARLKRRFSLCLTGTPVENNVGEFYSVLSAAVPGLFGSLKEFREGMRTDPDRVLGRAKPFILRRTKEKILKELPRKEEHDLFLEMSPIQKEIYTRTVSEVRSEIQEAYSDRPEQQAGIIALAAILRLRQVCVSPQLLGKAMKEPAPKFAYLAEKLEELHSEGNAALVFSQFRGALHQMELAAQRIGLPYLRMDGQTPSSKRKQIVADFQDENGPAFFFISLKTGGVGLNLTKANYVFHLDPWWNPAVENQASDRAHRIGQTRSVFIQRLVMRHTIEERMLELKAKKADLFRQLIDEPSSGARSKGLSRGDLEFLIEG